MPTNEDGEFELLLGNKQLLSVFFLVVLLLGVFFSMGYIVGRSTAPGGGVQIASSNKGPLVVDPVGTTTTALGRLPDPTKPSPIGPTPDPAKPEPPPSLTTTPKPEPVKPEPAKPEPPKPEPAKPKPEPPKPEPAKPPKPEPAKPEAGGKGTYLQVAATRKPEAELLMESLRKKGFGVATMPVPDSTLIRVLVGPFPDAPAIGEAKTKLKDLGISGPIPRKL
jgi:cell division septation protein DedD